MLHLVEAHHHKKYLPLISHLTVHKDRQVFKLAQRVVRELTEEPLTTP